MGFLYQLYTPLALSILLTNRVGSNQTKEGAGDPLLVYAFKFILLPSYTESCRIFLQVVTLPSLILETSWEWFMPVNSKQLSLEKLKRILSVIIIVESPRHDWLIPAGWVEPRKAHPLTSILLFTQFKQCLPFRSPFLYGIQGALSLCGK